MTTLREAAQAHLDAIDNEAKCAMLYESAKDNYHDCCLAESNYETAMIAASKAGKALRAALAEPEAPILPFVSRDEWHDKAWALYYAKTFDDLMLHKVSIHTLRTIFNATYDAIFLAQPEVIRSEEGTCYYADKDGNPVDGPVGTYTVSYYKGCKSLKNTEFQPCVDFPEGTHKLYLHPQRRPSDEEFKAWLIREMPSGTVISDPAWWAPRIIRALEKEQR